MVPFLLAIAIDLIFGDPPNRFHPVAWMGAWVRRWDQARGQPAADLARGAAALASGIVLTTAAAHLVERIARRLPWPVGTLVAAVAWKMTFSVRGLMRAATEVQQALETGNLQEARRRVAWHLVSRDTSSLSSAQVAAATVESVAENLSDGFVAPLFYGIMGGLPLAAAYRFVNTADAMLGYRDPAHEWLGKLPARADDLLNFLPARFTGLIIVGAAGLAGEDPRAAWQTLRRDARRTPSPNAGYPMSAMAGALKVRLEKPGVYVLGEGYPDPTPQAISRSLRVLRAAVLLVTVLCVLANVVCSRGEAKRRKRE